MSPKLSQSTKKNETQERLTRELGLFGAVFLGLGSMLGSGLFLSMGYAAEQSKAGFILALFLAGWIALCNALNSAQLASIYPTSGGAYEYGYQLLGPHYGFTAGVSFLIAKFASAASSALGAAFLLQAFLPLSAPVLAMLLTLLLTLCVMLGVKKSGFVNMILVTAIVAPLLVMIWKGFAHTFDHESFFSTVTQITQHPFEIKNFLYATAISFVAYTGYGRIATLGEEIRDPKKNLPRSILITLGFTVILYLAIGFVLLSDFGLDAMHTSFASQNIPVIDWAKQKNLPYLAMALSIAAGLAFISVLLNLILGLSRMLLAMARRQDAPIFLARLNSTRTSPTVAVLCVGFGVSAFAGFLNFSKNWSLSAISVLIYYTILNMAAFRLKQNQRRYPRWIAGCGIVCCLLPAAFVDYKIAGGFLAVLLAAHLLKMWRDRRLMPIK